MYIRKEEIIQKINQISQERHSYDDKFSQLQSMISQHKKYQIVNLRNKFASSLDQLHKIIKDNQNVVDLLGYRCEKLAKEGVDINSQKFRVQSLKEYFNQLKQKLKRQSQRGQQIITGRERWELSKYQGQTTHDQEQSLLNSHSTAKQTTQMARNVYQAITNQSSRLESARQKMGNVIKNVNFSGNLAQLMRTRTRQDNRLIAVFSIGLVIWILVCLFVFKPLIRGK